MSISSQSRTVVKITPPDLAGYQKSILYGDSRFTCTEASTKSGKTFSHIFWLFEYSHGYQDGVKVLDVKDGYEFWWVAPVSSQAKIAFTRMWRLVAKTGVYTRNLTELSITTPLGTVIRFKSADKPDSLYGEDVYAAVIDEYTRCKPDTWWAIRSTLTATKGPCKLIGNYKGQSNWGHQLALKAKEDPEWAYFRITAYDAVKAGILDEEEVEQARRDLPAFVFKALYMAEGDIDRARLISDEAIANIWTNDFVTGGKKAITADIAAYGSDMFVLFVWDGFRVIDSVVIEDPTEKEPQMIEELIRDKANQHTVPRSNIVYDADGLGAFLKGYLQGGKPFHNGAQPIKQQGHKLDYLNLKSQCYFAMAARMNDNGYFIADKSLERYKVEIIEDLECVKNRNLETDAKAAVLKKEEVKEIIGRSPDFSDALMMRELLELRTFGWLDNL